MKQVLDISQMKHLKELGVDVSKASAAQTDIWVTSDLDEFQKAEDVLVFSESESDYFEFENPIKKFTLQDILDLMPTVILSQDVGNDYWLELGKSEEEDNTLWYVRYMSLYGNCVNYEESKEIIDAAYSMLCWCVVNGYLETKE